MAQSGFRINVTFAFVIVPHCKAKSSKGKGNKKFSFNFCGKSEGKGDRTLASQWIFSFWSLLKIRRGIILGSFSLDLTHKLSLLLKSHKDDFPDVEIAGFKHSDNNNPRSLGSKQFSLECEWARHHYHFVFSPGTRNFQRGRMQAALVGVLSWR